jgi:SAM-dependent methyltransferase
MKFEHIRLPQDVFENKKILDIGCGRNKHPGAIGLDFMDLPGVDVVADLNKGLPFDDESFDVVMANQVLEHVQNLVELIYEIRRVLKPGGLLVAHVPYFRSSWAHVDPTHLRSFALNSMDYFVENTFIYNESRFIDEAFNSVDVYQDTEYPSTFLRRLFSSLALKHGWNYENTFLSSLYPFEQLTFVLHK